MLIKMAIVIVNMLWLYVTKFNGLWVSVIVTVIVLIAIYSNSKK